MLSRKRLTCNLNQPAHAGAQRSGEMVQEHRQMVFGGPRNASRRRFGCLCWRDCCGMLLRTALVASVSRPAPRSGDGENEAKCSREASKGKGRRLSWASERVNSWDELQGLLCSLLRNEVLWAVDATDIRPALACRPQILPGTSLKLDLERIRIRRRHERSISGKSSLQSEYAGICRAVKSDMDTSRLSELVGSHHTCPLRVAN